MRLSTPIVALFALLAVFSLAGCGDDGMPGDDVENGVVSGVEEGATAVGLEERADSVVAALDRQDWEALAAMVHPERGVRFSPYGYVDTVEHVVLSREEIANAAADETEYHWGQYDGRGNDIRLTIGDYYEEFIYDVDFADARRGEPGEVIGTGNTLVNLDEAYPGPNTRFIEYHDPGTEEYEGMDWNSLRLIFESVGGQWLLVGITHDQWTI